MLKHDSNSMTTCARRRLGAGVSSLCPVLDCARSSALLAWRVSPSSSLPSVLPLQPSLSLGRRAPSVKVGTHRWGVPAREPAGGLATCPGQRGLLERTGFLIAPLDAARPACRLVRRSLGEGRTAQRAIPTLGKEVDELRLKFAFAAVPTNELNNTTTSGQRCFICPSAFNKSLV